MSEPLSPEQEAHAQGLAARITARSADAIPEMARRLVATTDDTLFGDTEFALRARAQGIVADAYAEHPPQKVGTPRPPSTAPTAEGCPFHGYREKTVETLGGAVTCDRAYYHCGPCGTGPCPWDERVGLTARRHPPAVGRLATLCGAVADSFEKGTELLKETAGVRLSESTVQRAAKATGHRIAAHVHKGRTFGGGVAWDWFRGARGRTAVHIAIDATGVRQQGPTAHGRRAGWRTRGRSPIRCRTGSACSRACRAGGVGEGAVRERAVPAGGNGPAVTPPGCAGGPGSGGRVGGADRRRGWGWRTSCG